MTPADKSTFRQAAQLLQVLKDLSKEDLQRLLKLGNVLKLLAKRDLTPWQIFRLEGWALGYEKVVVAYWADEFEHLRRHCGSAVWWYIQLEDDTLVKLLEHYGIEWHPADETGYEEMVAALESHWEADRHKWYTVT